MIKLTVEIPIHWPEKEPGREARIKEILAGGPAQLDCWYGYLKKHLRFPFEAYFLDPNFTPTTKTYHNIKIIGLADKERCQARGIWLIGTPSMCSSVCCHLFLPDMSKLTSEEKTISAVLDYFYWINAKS